MKIIKLSPFIKDIGITTITSVLTTLSVIIVIRILAQWLGAEGFGAYALAKRFLSVVSPITTLAMGVALVRFIAISKDNHSKSSYLLGGLILGVMPSFVVLVIGLIFKDVLTTLIFRSEIYSSLFIATLFMIVGYSFYNILYSYYRGESKMGKANLWQLGIMAIGPILITFCFVKYGRADIIIFLMGVLFFITLLPLTFYNFKAISQDKQVLKIWLHVKELLRYGVPRVPAGVALAGILSIGPFLAPYFGSLKDAGYLIIGQSIFGIVEGGVSAFGIVALPKVTQLFIEGRNEFLKERVTDIIALVFHLGLFATFQLLLWSDQIVLVWLGNQYSEAIPLMMVILLALTPYLAYVILRSVIDAVEVRAVNTYNLYLSFAITLIVSLLLAMTGLGTMGLAIGTTTGFLVLGLLTMRYLRKIYKFNSDTFKIKECLLLNIAFVAIAFILKYWFVYALKGIVLMAIVFFVEGALLLFYFVFLWKLKVRWIIELYNRLFQGDVIQ